MLTAVVRNVILELKSVSIQHVIRSEWLVAKRHVGTAVLHNIHEREDAVAECATCSAAAAEVAVGCKAHLELVAQLVVYTCVQFTNYRENVIVDDVVGSLVVQGVYVTITTTAHRT